MQAVLRVAPAPFGLFLGQAAIPVPMAPAAAAPEAAEPIRVDRQTADATKVSIIKIDQAASKNKDVSLEPCWRSIRIAKWARVVSLRVKLERFLNTAEPEVVVTEPEFLLMDEILSCAEEIEKGETESLEQRLRTIGLVVGIAGGVATLAAAIF